MDTSVFPFLHLPRELRDAIYDIALADVRVDFLLANAPYDNESGLKLPKPELVSFDEARLFSWESWEEYRAHDDSLGPCLFYRLSAPTPLLRTCRQVAQELLHRYALIEQLVTNSIHLDRFVATPDPRLVAIVNRSCFALRTPLIGQSLHFLHQLPQVLIDSITHIVIGLENYVSENASNKGLLRAALAQLPALRDVALLVDSYDEPRVRMDMGLGMYEQVFCFRLLEHARINRFRVMYRRAPARVVCKCPCLLQRRERAMFARKRTMQDGEDVALFELHLVEEWSNSLQIALAAVVGRCRRGEYQMPERLDHEVEEWAGMERERKKWQWVGAELVVKLTGVEEEEKEAEGRG